MVGKKASIGDLDTGVWIVDVRVSQGRYQPGRGTNNHVTAVECLEGVKERFELPFVELG